MAIPNIIDQDYSVTMFDQISLRQNDAVLLPNGVKIVSGTGTVTFTGADIIASRFIGGAGFYPANTFSVSPSFTDNASARTYSTITAALAAVATNEPATILVYEGTYTEAITAKSKVNIIGVNNKKVIITSDGPVTVNVDGVTDFELKNLTIENTSTHENSYCLYIGGNSDSDLPNLDFVDLFIRKTSAVNSTANAVYCTTTSFLMKGCYLTIQGNGVFGTNVYLVNLAEYANPIFESCKFKIANSILYDCSIYTNVESDTDFTIGNCENDCAGYFIHCDGNIAAIANGRSFYNISNVGNGSFINRISPDTFNIVDANFSIR